MPTGTFSYPSLGGEEEKFALRCSFYQNNRPRRSFLSKKNASTHSLFYQINGANALIAILK